MKRIVYEGTTKTVNKKTLMIEGILVYINGKLVDITSIIALPKLVNVKTSTVRINGRSFNSFSVIGKY